MRLHRKLNPDISRLQLFMVLGNHYILEKGKRERFRGRNSLPEVQCKESFQQYYSLLSDHMTGAGYPWLDLPPDGELSAHGT